METIVTDNITEDDVLQPVENKSVVDTVVENINRTNDIKETTEIIKTERKDETTEDNKKGKEKVEQPKSFAGKLFGNLKSIVSKVTKDIFEEDQINELNEDGTFSLQ